MKSIWMCGAALVLAACGSGNDSQAKAPTAATSPATTGAAATNAGNSVASGPAVASETRSFRDWRVTCDNGNRCVAFTGEDGFSGWIRVSIDAGPNATPSVAVGLWSNQGDSLSGAMTLTIDGRSFVGAAGPADTSSGVIAANQAGTVVSALTAGRAMVVTTPGADPTHLSVSGASAAMLWIDERQGRLDTTTALIRKGTKPASSVPAAPVLPTVTVGPAASQTGFTGSLNPINDDAPSPKLPAPLEAMAAVQECRANLDFNPEMRIAVTGSRLNDASELWGVPCDSGAYNFTYAYFITGPNGTNPRSIRFPQGDGTTTVDLTNSAYDPATREMTAFAKGRGIGDCGIAQTWLWTGQAFALKTESVMGECWGMVSDYWPTTFRSR